jgi:hypothetical protein
VASPVKEKLPLPLRERLGEGEIMETTKQITRKESDEPNQINKNRRK